MILITTGGGKVGQHVVSQLAQKKVPTRAGFHSQARAAEARETGIEAVVSLPALASLMTFASSFCLWMQSFDALIRKFTAPDHLQKPAQ